MLKVNPVMLLVKVEVPVPSFVLVDSAIVGFVDVDQTTPLADIDKPPSLVIEPPLVAAELEILVAASVDPSVGELNAKVVKELSAP